MSFFTRSELYELSVTLLLNDVYVLQSLLLQIAHGILEEEAAEAEQEKQRYMEENCPALALPGSMQELLVHTHTHTHTLTHTHTHTHTLVSMFYGDVP